MTALTIDNKQEKSCPPGQENGQNVATHPKTDPKKSANRVFNIINYIGFGWIANSTLSLIITYNILPGDFAQQIIKGAEKNLMLPIVKAWDSLKASVKLGKAFDDLSEAEKFIKNKSITNSARSMAEICCMFIAGCIVLIPMKVMEDHKKWWVDKFDQFIPGKKARDAKAAAIDAQQPEKSQEAEVEPKAKRQTWGKLLAARVVGMAAVLGVDGTLQAFNNSRDAKGLGNLDTAEWKTGSWLYDKLPTKFRDSLLNFFARKNANVDSIQPLVRQGIIDSVLQVEGYKPLADKLLKIEDELKKPGLAEVVITQYNAEKQKILSEIAANSEHAKVHEFQGIVDELVTLNNKMKNHPSLDGVGIFGRRKILEGLEAEFKPQKEAIFKRIAENSEFSQMQRRMVMAEQTRLFTKEVSLTLLMAGLIFGLSKTGVLPWCKEKITGLFSSPRNKAFQKDHEILMEDMPLMPIVHIDTNGHHSEKQSTDKSFVAKERPAKTKIESLQAKAGTHAERAVRAQDSTQLQVM